MQNQHGLWLSFLLGALVAVGISACAAKAPVKPMAYEETPVPTVPPSTPTPLATAAPLPTRPIAKKVKARPGHPIGPIVTFFGAVRADGHSVKPASVDKRGIPTYLSSAGSGFILVVEGKPGPSGLNPGLSVFSYVPNDPRQRPDLQIESDRNMGDGSRTVCDKRLPNIGGIPGIRRPDFAETKFISDALNDFACRFETFTQSDSACTMMPSGDFSFIAKDTTMQYCMVVARAWAFPVGNTTLTVRLLDTDGNPGPIKQVRIHRPPTPKVPVKKK